MIFIKPKCKHKWVDVNDGTDDVYCINCLKFAMQNRLSMPMAAEISAPIDMSWGRERVEVPLFTGDKHIRVSIFKDDLINQMQKEQGLLIDHFSNSVGR